MTDAAHAAALLLLLVVIPVWIAAGTADYLCHRAAHIESTSGPRESLLHLLQLASVGAPLVAALFLDIDAGLLALMLLCILVHHLIAYVDIAYANNTRRVTPLEQMVHSFLEIAPITAFLLVGVLYWPQLQSLFGVGPADSVFACGRTRFLIPMSRACWQRQPCSICCPIWKNWPEH
jgi:hypothetical protein